ncbi:uncharacterized protein A1O5_09231 [Cladophialophora psammophila CBS 110553]|uniref:Uncharacterized protein n=1 Tax=Cladophialophora psammophila CBS 110553 TaxID=1182543 RepID=W9XBS6_9EURO|nr:uncharacterized protein A1O5_09231 [Cladophialophora psammophila CBS 110553]EXJ67884.1 hypothetical protein A1O5_09231 [Cladophialophora psammophila CBS 110553]
MSANPILVSDNIENQPVINLLPDRVQNTTETLNGTDSHTTNGTDGLNSHVPQEFPDTAIENFRPLRVVVIGAGYSGIYMGIRIPEWLRNVDLTIYEKNPAVGGTWYENRYPGCACDIPAHSYVYTFEPNPHWSTFYAGGPEIQDYLDRTSEKYGAKRFIKCGHRVFNCQWNKQTNKWELQVEVTSTGQKFDDQADVVICARGAFNEYAWPEIEGLRSFEGKTVHSAAWDTNYDYSNKRIGVIGNGSSAIQIVPTLLKLENVRVSNFAKGKTWVSPSFGDNATTKLGLKQLDFKAEDQEAFIKDPEWFERFRHIIESEANAVHGITQKGSPLALGAQKACEQLMRDRLAGRPDIAEALIPSFAPGCRRLTPGPGYLEALTNDNVEFIKTPIVEINPQGIKLLDGRQVDLDVLVCATGFYAMAAPPFPVVGTYTDLASRFKPYPDAYMSTAVDGFPNFFLMLGPNSGVGSGSLTKMIEATGDYIARCIRKLQKDNISAMTVKAERLQDWSAFIDAYFPKTVFMDDCKSWYRSDQGTGNRVIGLWPGSTLHAIEALRSPRWEDYEYVYDGDREGKLVNRLNWLGNGWSILQTDESGDPGYYVQREYIDYPSHPRPEETPKWKKLPFTY